MTTVLFDMDGTLLNTLEDLDTSVNYALAKAGLPLVTRAQTAAAAGFASVALIDTLTGHAYPTDSPEFKQVWGDFVEHYNEHHNDTTKPYAGMMDLLAELKARGCKMGVVSNKMQRDTEQLRELWFSEYLDVAVGCTPELPKKPAPDMLLAALERLGSNVEDAVFVGDSEPDVQIAQNAGCVSVAVTWGFRTREVLEALHPDHIIDEPSQLLAVIDGLR